MIANIVRLCFPELAEKRQREMEEDRTTLTALLPIFYCENCPRVFPPIDSIRCNEHIALVDDASILLRISPPEQTSRG